MSELSAIGLGIVLLEDGPVRKQFLTIENITSQTVFRFTCSVSADGEVWHSIESLRFSNERMPELKYDKTYRITIPDHGIYIGPWALMYLDLEEMLLVDLDLGRLEVRYSYSKQSGDEVEATVKGSIPIITAE